MSRWDKLIEQACQAQEEFTLEELEAHAAQLQKDEREHGEA